MKKLFLKYAYFIMMYPEITDVILIQDTYIFMKILLINWTSPANNFFMKFLLINWTSPANNFMQFKLKRL